MKLSKFFIFGLGACTLSTFLSAGFIECPKFGDIHCQADEHSTRQHFCRSIAPWDIGTLLKEPVGQYMEPEFTSVKANQATQTCDYTYQGGLVLKLQKQPSTCTVTESPSLGFNCP